MFPFSKLGSEIKKCLYEGLNKQKVIRYQKILIDLEDEISTIGSCEKEGSLKILIGPSFCIYPPCYIHDKIISLALRLRGATIIPIYCDGIQKEECTYCGGKWYSGSFETNCKNCYTTSKELWSGHLVKPIPLSRYLSKDDKTEVSDKVLGLYENWPNFKEDNLPIGSWAKDIIVNNYTVGDYRLINEHDKLGIIQVENLLLLYHAYKKLINEIKPDRVISNDSYYGIWGLLENICKEKNIPFYSHWQGGTPGSWCYAYNDAAMNLNFRPSWNSFCSISLSKEKKDFVKNWLTDRISGKDLILDTSSLATYKNKEFDLNFVQYEKKTALLSANIIWDLAALNKQLIFDDMIDWIIQTIDWFKHHPDYQLLIKPHPGELHPMIPNTYETVEYSLKKREVKLPDNVFLLHSNVNLTVYDLFPIVDLGLVHTSTVGLEMAASGIPVITTAKSPYRGFGFTFDPSTPDEYFYTMEKFFNDDISNCIDNQIDLAYKFILFYFFHYYCKIDIMEHKWGNDPIIKIKRVNDLLPGKNEAFDYILDRIMLGEPIISENQWPPFAYPFCE